MAQILNTGYQRSGKNARVDCNGGANKLVHSSWKVDDDADDLDTVNFESQGYGEGIAGIEECKLSFGGDWNAHANFLDNPPGLYPRDDLATLRFFLNTTDGTYWGFAYSRLRNISMGAEVKGKITFSVSQAMSQGVFSRPTGSV